MAGLNRRVHTWVLFLYLVVPPPPFVCGFTDPRDVYAIYQLHANLGSPLLPKWIHGPQADPCGPPSWHGVECVNANITQINLSGANLGGRLSEDLGSFASIMILNLSNNHIGGPIPTNLPVTLMIFDLSYNQFGDRIPDTLSSLGQLQKLSLKNNQFAGPIPDAFESLAFLTTMDLSGNSLTDELPSSMASLSSLITLHLQNNQLTGLLDVLEDLPLTDLNIENNLFSGPIPPKLLSIPDFRRGSNPFNTTIIASPPAWPPSPAPSEAPSSQYIGQVPVVPGPPAPTVYTVPSPTRGTGNKTTWIAIGLFVVAVLVLLLCISVFRCCKKVSNPPEITPPGRSQTKTGFLKPGKDQDHSIDMRERVVVDPTFNSTTMKDSPSKSLESTQFFTVASLQQYTNSFSQESLIGKGTLGAVYRAQLPDGRVVAVKKLDKAASGHVTDVEFLDLVSRVSKLRHENVVELVGYCLEHGQRLLVYNHYRNGTLDEALNFDDAMNGKLSWNVRMRLALQAAKALEYLHEVCKPPIVHRNFTCCNVLLLDDLSIRVSDCGLAPLMSTISMAQAKEVLRDAEIEDLVDEIGE